MMIKYELNLSKLIYFLQKELYMIKEILIQNSRKFVNYSVIDHELLKNIIYDVGKSYKDPTTPFVVILLPPT